MNTKTIFLAIAFSFCSSRAFCADASSAAAPQKGAEISKAAPHEASNEEISKALSNPVANIINVPFQMNWDYGAGPNGDGQDYYMKIQPVIPVQLTDDWRMLSRSIFIVESKYNMGFDGETGLGDWTQTFFISPVKKEGDHFVWGAGPVFLIPTATENHLGQKKWGIGPSVILVEELEDWTIGILANHIWDLWGDSDRNYVSQSFLQPFVARHFPHAIAVTLTSEYTYDWHEGDQYVPINLMVSKVFRIGKLPINVSLGGRYYIDKPTGGPDWGLRLMITFVLPSFQ